MIPDTPNIFLVNPWIHDFAAYDFWAKPLGLLTLGAILRTHGFNVFFIDCLDRFHPRAAQTDPHARFGRGPYLKTRIRKPQGLEDIPRNFSRYGILPEWFGEDLLSFPKPDLVLVTSLMTYWYPGVRETIDTIKNVFPGVRIVLGGIYAGLCPEHAALHSGADRAVAGPGEENILRIAGEHTGYWPKSKFDPNDLNTYPYPAFELQRKISCIPLLTSRGCPFSCAYCASHVLYPKRRLRNPAAAVEEMAYWRKAYDVSDFVLYDDAFLVDAEHHAVPLLEGIIAAELKIRLHTPNAVHIRGISPKIARLMARAGVETLRLGLETAVFENRNNMDEKVTAEEFIRAVSDLKAAGFRKNQVGAYLLAGLPGQSLQSLEASIETVRHSGITPVIAYYSPIPRTALWDRAAACSRYDLESDPIFTNNAILPCQEEGFSWKTITGLKTLAAMC